MATNSTVAGLIAGAAGTTALNAVTYLDMAIRGRPASAVPDETVEKIQTLFGTTGSGGAADTSRRTAMGALGGIVTGLVVGTAASYARAAGLRLPTPAGAVATGLAAMVAADVPITLLGISDPRTWTVADWASDIVPHLVYGAAVQRTLERLAPSA